MNLAEEEARLAHVNRQIAEGEMRLAQQTVVVGELAGRGEDASDERAVALTLKALLAGWYARRAEIQARLEEIRAELT